MELIYQILEQSENRLCFYTTYHEDCHVQRAWRDKNNSGAMSKEDAIDLSFFCLETFVQSWETGVRKKNKNARWEMNVIIVAGE